MATAIAILPHVSELSKGLPDLICETDIERQLVNIENWLKLFLPVDATGLSISGFELAQTAVFATNVSKDAIQAVDGRLAEAEAGSGDPAAEGLSPFVLLPDHAVASNTADHARPSDAGGIAFRLEHQGRFFGTFFLVTAADTEIRDAHGQATLHWLKDVLSSLMYNSFAHHQQQEKMRLLNLYETVSSSLCYAGDLQELLTTIISIVVSELPSEEGSILLYDDTSNELEFFSAIGDTGAGLVQCRFPADKGIAGKALQEGAAVIIDDVQTCPYFFSDFDDQCGFVTRSILAVPIISGGEKVGVIEAINKVGRPSFDDRDGRILTAISDEVGLAVKNARMFDYVVNSYCKLRQGLTSCKGCVRPLKSWTPCARQLDQ